MMNRLTILTVLLALSSLLFAQPKAVHFKSGAVVPPQNVRQSFLDTFNASVARSENRALAVFQFQSLPAEGTRMALAKSGIDLLDYLPDNAYTVSFGGNLTPDLLKAVGVRSVFALVPQQKMEEHLSHGQIPAWAVKVGGTADLWVSFPKTFSAAVVSAKLKDLNFDVLESPYSGYRILQVRCAVSRLTELASQPFIDYVQPAPPGDQPLNFNSEMDSRANYLNASVGDGGKGLNGEGVVLGIGDNSDIQTHMDFSGRLINRTVTSPSYHGTHTAGTMAGAGIINERVRGYAPKATVINQYFSGILSDAATYVNDYGMVVTNNSYGDIIECDYHGTYDMISRILDQMALDLPSLENVFAAGNSGASTCPPYAAGFHTVLGGYQSAKNVLTVGATSDSGAIAPFSSRGPVKDGRVKPEVMAMGQNVYSSVPTNGYGYNNGTSMAAPAASGGLALLYQRYRQLHGGTNPKNGLMKALLCNGGVDRGNDGPDFQYGFGWMNLLRSMEMLDNNRYLTASVGGSATNNHAIIVPANTAQLKVMLYWNDPAASLVSSRTLVNDLDLEVATPALSTILPRILDTATANLNTVATSGADHTNNMEQVVINAPGAGTYSVKVKGTAITQNAPQEYFLVYDVIPVGMKVTAPAGGEALVPGEGTKISWDAFGYASGTVTIEFSTDGGASWITVASGVNINRYTYTWTVPQVSTAQARVRITKEGSGETTTTNPFTIIGQPTVSLNPVQCDGYINLTWTAATGATDYEVMTLQGDEMKTVATTTATSYTLGGLSKDSTYWVTVRARINGKSGRRAGAIARQPTSGSCSGTISDNDLKVDAIISPKSGRRFTSTQLSAASVVTVRIKNIDDAPVSSFDVKYSINGGAWVTEIVSIPLAAGAVYTHSFATTVDLSAPGSYNLSVVVKNAVTDPVTANDTLSVVVKHLDNQPLDLTTYFIDNIESAAPATYQKDPLGLAGLPRYDVTPSTAYGRLRTFVNTGISRSGTKALTLDVDRFYPSVNTNYLFGTFNLVNYNVTTNDIRLDFQYLSHGQEPNVADRVWIRGSDTQPWIVAFDLDSAAAGPGLYKKTSSIEIAHLLSVAGQSFTPSFGVRWGQGGAYPAADKLMANGFSFDDIRLYQVSNDLQLKSIDSPSVAACALSATSPVKVTIRNSAANAVTAVPVRYRINGGAWVSETIPSIAANSTVRYSFATPANLSAFGPYTIETVVDYSGDTFRENDTAYTVINNVPVINQFPYLQTFEGGNGWWFPGGKSSSWEYGTPASTKITRAASGAKAWKTRLAGSYNDNERSYLYSPCFDVTGMAAPALSFSVALDIEDCGSSLCDGAWVEYSTDGISWTKLGAAGSGTNWYNKGGDQLWSVQNYTRWHVATTALPTGINRLRLRFVMASDPGVNREGIAIDDIHIYDNTAGIWDGASLAAPPVQGVSGNGWSHFTSGEKLIASIQPSGQNLGTTAVQAFISPAVRNINNQYYHNRSLTIKPATRIPADSVAVRFYFTDGETEALLNAADCASCTKPSSAYELGVSKYTDADTAFENGSVLDDQQGMWDFINGSRLVMVPFDKGYYAEFKVKDFSEFWLGGGGLSRSEPLPVKLLDFTAQKQSGGDVLLRWSVGTESAVSRYEVQLAMGDAALQANGFTTIGEVAATGAAGVLQYSFTDTDPLKYGGRYYRLKIINADGSFTYSPVRAVVFTDLVPWQVFPNPSKGRFFLAYQLNNNEELKAKVYDGAGRLVREYRSAGTGFLQKLSIDLSTNYYATGVYLLQVEAGGRQQAFRLYKQ